MNNIRYAISLAQTMYDTEVDTDDAIEIALIAYKFIGNKQTKLRRAILEIVDNRAKLPCDCIGDCIEAICYIGPEDWSYSDNIHEWGDVRTSYIEDYIEGEKMFLDPLYQRGKYVKYRREGDYIYTNKGSGHAIILYHTEILDAEGLPEITDKEAVAIAEYIAYTVMWKNAIKEKNQTLFTMAAEIKKQWLIHCDAARVPELMSQNEADAILNANTSHGRKSHGYSYKPTL